MTPSPASSSAGTCGAGSSATRVFLLAAGGVAVACYVLWRRRRSRKPAPTQPSTTAASMAACALARAWIAIDPDVETRDAVAHALSRFLEHPLEAPRLLDSLDPANRLRFGTAGVRAQQGPGYDRINALVLIGVAQAVARFAKVSNKPVVIGHDARFNSRKYAVLLADVFAHAGARVMLFSTHVPTPFVAYAVNKKNCAVGLCVTASHNPPNDNGLKVFWRDGIQIRPHIARRIERLVPECSRPLKAYALTEEQLGTVEDPLAEISSSYYADMSKLSLRREHNIRAPRVVYTAFHGVGTPYIVNMFKTFGLQPPILCNQQCDPDPAFPTLPFPNPEENGALDIAVETARDEGAHIILANDPDADRLGVAEVGADRKVRIFSGDEIAALLTDYLTNMIHKDDMSEFATVASAVSSKILASMGKERGFLFRESLTGFKWINKEALNLESEGKVVLVAYEEALGYNVTRNIVRDKDGVSAAAVFAELAGYVYQSGKTLAERLDDIEDECGVHLSYNGYLRLSGESPAVQAIFEQARIDGMPKQLGTYSVRSVRDLSRGTDTAEPDGKARLPADDSSQFITFRCSKHDSPEDETPLIIHLRGSGTEPKIKYYAELRCSRDDAKSGAARALLKASVRDAVNKILIPRENKLIES